VTCAHATPSRTLELDFGGFWLGTTRQADPFQRSINPAPVWYAPPTAQQFPPLVQVTA